MAANLKGHWVVAHRLTARRGWLVDNRTQRVSEWRLANIHPRAAKKPLWNIARVTAPSRSVGRLSAGHHRLILPLCELRQRTASTPLTPPQRHYNSKDKINILQREPLGTIHTVVTFVEIPSR